MIEEYKRECGKCGKELIYKSKLTYSNAIKKDGLCRSCAGREKIESSGKRAANLSLLLEDSYESFYWVGFIMADGCFHDNRLTITLSIKDKYHLQKFADFIEYSIPLIDTDAKTSFKSKNVDASPLICKKFDLKPAKTYNPPKTIKNFPIDLQYCLLAGFIDGDGNIQNQSGGRKDYSLRIKNHSSWINILTEFNELIDGTSDFTEIKNSGYAQLTISNTDILKEFRKKIESYNLPLMRRKWDKIDYNYQSRTSDVLILRNNILEDFKNNISTKEVALKYNTSYANAYRIRKKYYEQ